MAGQWKLILGIILMLGCMPCSPARGATVWQIGKFDRTSREFGQHIPAGNPAFTIGQSAVEDWPARQPGSQNPSQGLRSHPYKIVFNLAAPPRGGYRLEIAAILDRPRVPHLEVSINGKTGEFYFHPHLSYYPGEGGAWSPIYATDRLEVDLPSRALRAGQNELVLTAIDDPKDGPGDSWVTYDALRLVNEPIAEAERSPQISLRPTIYYAHGDEMIRADVTLSRKLRSGRLQLIMNGGRYTAELSSMPDFGEQQLEIEVPEFSGSQTAEVSLRVDGRTFRKSFDLQPARKWKLYLVPHEHLDVGFTDYRGKVAEVHDRNIDHLLQLLAAHPEMRWSLDGTWIVQHYLASRKPSAQKAFFNLVREGKIGVPAQYANILTGFASLEELIRSMFYGYRLHQEKSIPFDYVNITDVPSYTWSYPSILHALGIRYFAAASNNDRAPIILWGRWNTKSPFWWQGPDGSKVLMSYSRQYQQLTFVCQLPASPAACRESLPTFLQAYTRPSYKPDAALLYGTQVENTYLVPGDAEFVQKWNETYSYPHFVIATFPDYFRYVDTHFGSELPTITGDGGPYWEDGVGTDARYAAIDRIDQQRALSAEKLSTLGTYVQKNVAGEQAQIRAMWRNLILYAEHTFTSWGGYSRPRSEETRRQQFTKDQFVVNARQDINSIVDQSMSQLADQIHIPAPAIVVFNSLSWKRSGLVETDLNDGMAIQEYPSNKTVPYQILRRGSGYNHVRFLARDVPSMGYRCYQIVRSSAPAAPTSLPVSNTIENGYYRVTFDPTSGAISSIYDKQLGKELAPQSSAYRVNQYLYVSGGEGSQIVFMNKSLPLAKLSVSTSASGRVTSIQKTSFGTVMSYETSGSHAPKIDCDVILFDHQKKIEFIDHLHKQPSMNKEAVYFAFPFAIAKPDFTYEIQNGWVDPAHDILKGGSLEWFTVRHWVRVSGADFSAAVIPLDAPLVSLGDINRGLWPKAFKPKSATVFSYAMNNYWHTNYFRVQSGKYTFRYVLTSGASLAPSALARLGRAAMTPLELRQVISNDKHDNPERPLSPAGASFITVDAPNVVVEDWKAAEDGNGSILRLLEIGGVSANARVTFPMFHLQEVWKTNAVEQNLSQLGVQGNSVEVPMAPHGIVTLRVRARN